MAELISGFASIPLRLILGIVFIYHGYPKLKDLKGTAGFVGGLGFKPAILWAFLLGATEFFGGALILMGLFTRVASALLIISMLVALYFNKFKWGKPFKGGYELDLVLIFALLALFILGAGIFSVDNYVGWLLG